MEINYDLLFKLAQDKGYKLYFTALEHGNVVFSHKKEEFGLMEMWLIQKWLWDSHRIFVTTVMDYHEKFMSEVNRKKSNDTQKDFISYGSDKYKMPENALESGLLTALRLVPDFKGIKTGQHSFLSPDINDIIIQ